MGKRAEADVARRREVLVRALGAGLFAAAGWGRAQTFGRVPGRLPAGQSIYELRGRVLVDGQPASASTRIPPAAVVETGAGASITFVVGADAYLLRERSRLELRPPADGLVSLLRVATGALLSVFGPGPRRLETSTATIGIRGTGVYLESEPDRTYVCNCYGVIDVAAAGAPGVQERITSTHHDAPRYVLAAGGGRIVPGGFINHSDLELMLLENLVGRRPPFSLFDESYSSPRRY